MTGWRRLRRHRRRFVYGLTPRWPKARPGNTTGDQGKLRGRQPKLSPRRQAELRRMHASGDYSIADLAELFTVSRPTVYRTL